MATCTYRYNGQSGEWDLVAVTGGSESDCVPPNVGPQRDGKIVTFECDVVQNGSRITSMKTTAEVRGVRHDLKLNADPPLEKDELQRIIANWNHAGPVSDTQISTSETIGGTTHTLKVGASPDMAFADFQTVAANW